MGAPNTTLETVFCGVPNEVEAPNPVGLGVAELKTGVDFPAGNKLRGLGVLDLGGVAAPNMGGLVAGGVLNMDPFPPKAPPLLDATVKDEVGAKLKAPIPVVSDIVDGWLFADAWSNIFVDFCDEKLKPLPPVELGNTLGTACVVTAPNAGLC